MVSGRTSESLTFYPPSCSFDRGGGNRWLSSAVRCRFLVWIFRRGSRWSGSRGKGKALDIPARLSIHKSRHFQYGVVISSASACQESTVLFGWRFGLIAFVGAWKASRANTKHHSVEQKMTTQTMQEGPPKCAEKDSLESSTERWLVGDQKTCRDGVWWDNFARFWLSRLWRRW